MATPTTGQAQEPVPFLTVPIEGAGVDGPVWVTELVGNELWIGGDFASARDHALEAPTVATSGLAVMDINSGDLLARTFAFDGEVYGIEHHDDMVWVVGEFQNLDGVAAQNIVAFDAFTGERDPGFVAAVSSELRDVVYHDGWLYLGGNIDQYNGTSVDNVVRVDPRTGALDASWLPQVTRYVEDLDAYGDLIAVAERADDIRAETKLISLVTGLKVDGLDAASRLTSGMWNAEFSSDGTTVYLAETGNAVSKFTAVDELLWVSDQADGDMQAVAVTDDYVFAGFHDGWFDDTDRKMIALDAATGQIDNSWYVSMNSFWGVWDIAIYDQGLVATGEFTTASGVSARRIAVFRPTGPWLPAEALERPTLGDVNCDELVDIVDALFLAQYSVDNRETVASCDGFEATQHVYIDYGDVDGDGFVGVVDALIIAQCAVGIPRDLCPADPVE